MSQRLELVVGFAVIVIVAVSRKILMGYNRIEQRFVDNLNGRENTMASPLNDSLNKHLIDRNIHLAEVKIPVSSQYIGKTLQETNVKQQYGITIVKITRGLLEIDIPEADEMVYPQDVWMILGNDEQISRFSNDIDVENSKTTQYEKTDIILDSYLIEPQSILCGKTILETGLKENQHCLIIGIERQGKSIMNPHYSTVLEENDLIWIVGDKKRLHKFLKNN